jgi:hypothetical protein
MMRDCSVSGLARALSTQRMVTRQAVALGLFLGICALARLSPFREPEPVTGALILISAVGAAIFAVWMWAKREYAMSIADELILLGFAGERRRTPVDCALANRIAAIETPRARHRLAEDLRWRVRLASGAARLSPGCVRASVFPPLGSVRREVFLEERLRLTRVANQIEQSQVDPRALVILSRIVTDPPLSCQPGVDQREHVSAEEVRDALRQAYRLAEGRTDERSVKHGEYALEVAWLAGPHTPQESRRATGQ